VGTTTLGLLVAGLAVGLMASSAAALPGGTAPDGTAAMSPVSGNSGTTFSLALTNALPQRTVTDGVLTAGSTTVTSATISFASTDVGRAIAGGTIPPNATIVSVTDATTAVISAAPTASATGVSLTVGIPANCSGDSATGSYRWQTFFVASSYDVATLTYNASGPVPVGGVFAQPLYSAGTPVVNRTTAVGTPTNPGQIVNIPTFSWSLYPAGFVPAGTYKVGIACTLSGQTTDYWQRTVTVTANPSGGPAQFNYAQGAVPEAPTGVTVAPGNGELGVSWAAPAGADPVVTSYKVYVDGAYTGTPATGASTTLTGLTNGTSYSITVSAVNDVGEGPQSSPVSGTPALASQSPVQNLVASAAVEGIDLSFQAPAAASGTQNPVSYTITFNGGPVATPPAGVTGTNPFSVTAAPAAPLEFRGMTVGTTYTIVVDVVWPASPGYASPPAQVQATPLSNRLITQTITVTRPQGALIMTQRCSVYGPLPAFSADAAFPGYPKAGTDWSGGNTNPAFAPASGQPTGESSARYAEYPNPSPATYPTDCGLSMGTASLVLSGPADFIGNYYAAEGRLNQVSILDTRDVDDGWTVSGQVGDFALPGNADSFSGNYLGWIPQVTYTSPTTGGGYTQAVAPGPRVKPGDGISSGSGLQTAPKVLASANTGQGLGLALLDARLQLLIPASANFGTYTGVLTLTAS